MRTLQRLNERRVETHLVISKGAAVTLAYETDLKVGAFRDLASRTYAADDLTAPISSGSFRPRGMLIIPCSMRTVGEIATGTPSSLLTRAADVVLKERRRLVLVARETPLTLVHLRNMATISEMGGIIAPPVPALYSRPTTTGDIIDHTVGRVLDLFDLPSPDLARWTGHKISQHRAVNPAGHPAGLT